MFKKALFAGCLLLANINAEEIPIDQLIYAKQVDDFELKKIQLEGHTYFHLHERWAVWAPHFWHDPECEKCKINEEMLRLHEKKDKHHGHE